MKSTGSWRLRASGIAAALIVAFLPVASPAVCEPANPETEGHLVLFHFNDLHGRIERLARMATLLRAARRESLDFHLLCAGDNFSGNPAVDQADPRGEPVLKLLNELNIKAMVLGNHEFDYGQAVLQGFIRRARFPILCANVDASGAAWSHLRSQVNIASASGAAMTVLGLIQIEPDSGIPSAHPSRVKGLSFQDPLAAAKRMRGTLPADGVKIALSHLGYATDRQLAEALPELDVIVGGHSHTVLDPGVEHNGVLIVQAGAHGDYLGRVDLYLRNGRVYRRESRLIPLKDVQPAADILAMVKAFESNPVLQRVVTHLPRALEGKTELGNWICDLLRARLDLDVAFQNAGGVRIQRLEGAVKLQDVYQMLPFENLIVRMDLFPRELRSLIATDVSKHGRIDLLMSGLNVRVSRTPAGETLRIELLDTAGNPLKEDKRYAVGFNSYIASSYRFTHEDPGRSLEVTTAAAVIAYLESGQPVIPADPRLRAEEEVVSGTAGSVEARSEESLETGKDPFSASSPAGNLMADAMREFTKSDVALFPSRLVVPGIRIAAGSPIGQAQVRAMYRHAARNGVRVLRMQGGELADFVLKRARYRGGVDLQLSGLTCRLNRDASGNIDAMDCRLPDGSPLEKDKQLRVAVCDYDLDRYYKLDVAAEPARKGVTLEAVLLKYLELYPRLDAAVSAPRVVFQKTTTGE